MAGPAANLLLHELHAGCYGQWASVISNPSASLQQHNGAIVSSSISPYSGSDQDSAAVAWSRSRRSRTARAIPSPSASTPACSSSTDPENSFNKWNWWVSGNYGDTAFTVFYPINAQKHSELGRWCNGGHYSGQGVPQRRDELPPRRGQYRLLRWLRSVLQGLHLDLGLRQYWYPPRRR